VLNGVETIVHAAGRAHVLRESTQDPLAVFRRSNVETTKALIEEAAASGVKRFVLLSSVAVFGNVPNGVLQDSTPTIPTTAYGVSKLEAEQVVQMAGRAKSLEVTILRLPLVYGAGMKGNPLRLFRLIRRGTPLPLGSVKNLRSLLYVENLVAAVSTLLESPRSTGGSFLVADSQPISTPDLVRLIARAIGCPARLWNVPLPLVRALGRIGDAVNAHRYFPLTSDAIARLSESLVVDTANVARFAGSEPFATLEEGIMATGSWFRGEGDAGRES